MRILLLLLSVFLCACSTTYPIALRSPLTQPPLVERHPVTVAVRYSDGLKSHRCVADRGYLVESWIVELGPPSIAMFDRIFAALFERVVTPEEAGNADPGAKATPLIEVDLLAYDGCEASWPIVGAGIGVAYEATLRNAEGTVLARWQGRGRAEAGADISAYTEGYRRFAVETRHLGGMTQLAMRRAAADFIFGFDAEPGIRAWLAR